MAVVVAAVATGCGSRVTEAQRQAVASTGTAQSVRASATENGTSDQSAVVASGQSSRAAVGVPGAPAQAASSAGPSAAQTLTASDVGITPSEVRVAQVATLSGPVPGLFEGSVVGVRAAIAYQNSLGGVNGRKLVLDVHDDGFDSAQARSEAKDAVSKDFAFVGSFTAVDDAYIGGMPPTVPDLGVAISSERGDAPNNFSVTPNGHGAAVGPFAWLNEHYTDATQAVGSLYSSVAANVEQHRELQGAAESAGWKWKYERSFQPTETDFTADIIRMRQAGVKLVYLVSDASSMARVLTAAAQQNWKATFVTVASGYDSALLKRAGSAADGLIVHQPNALFMGEDAGSVPEVALMLNWIHKVKPGFTADLYAATGWAEARLFFRALATAGPNPTRASVLGALRSYSSYDSYGMFADAGPATKRAPECYVFATVRNGAYVRLAPSNGFICQPAGFRRQT